METRIGADNDRFPMDDPLVRIVVTFFVAMFSLVVGYSIGGLVFSLMFMSKDEGTDDIAKMNRAAVMTTTLKAAKPGDLAIQTGGQIVVLGLGRDYVVYNDIVHFSNIHWLGEAKKPVSSLAETIEHVASKSDRDYGTLASCHFKGKSVVMIDYRYTCGD
jgi:hypothetical protein